MNAAARDGVGAAVPAGTPAGTGRTAGAAVVVDVAVLQGAAAAAEFAMSSALLGPAGRAAVQPGLQDRDGRSLVDDGTLPAPPHATLAQRAGGRNRRQPLVDQAHRHRSDSVGECRGVGLRVQRGRSASPGKRPGKTHYYLDHLVFGDEFGEPREVATGGFVPRQGNQGRRQDPLWITERNPNAHGTHVHAESASLRRSNRRWFHQP